MSLTPFSMLSSFISRPAPAVGGQQITRKRSDSSIRTNDSEGTKERKTNIRLDRLELSNAKNKAEVDNLRAQSRRANAEAEKLEAEAKKIGYEASKNRSATSILTDDSDDTQQLKKDIKKSRLKNLFQSTEKERESAERQRTIASEAFSTEQALVKQHLRNTETLLEETRKDIISGREGRRAAWEQQDRMTS